MKRIYLLLFFLLLANCLFSQVKKPYRISKAITDHEFDSGSNISAILLTPQKTADLALLGKVWGFLKYYHPAVAKGNYNWDYELFRIMPKIIACKSADERNAVFADWVDKLGAVEPGNYSPIDEK